MRTYIDEEERRIMEAFDKGEYVQAPNAKELKEILQKAAENHRTIPLAVAPHPAKT